MRALLLAALLLVSVAASSSSNPVLNNIVMTKKNVNSIRVELDSGAENRGGNGDDSDSYEDESDVTNKNYFAKKQLDRELSKRNGSLSFGIGQVIVDKVCNVADNLKWSKLFRKKEYKFIDVDDWFPDESRLHNTSATDDESSSDEVDEEDSPKKNDNGRDYGCDEILRAQFPHLFQDPHFYNG